MGPSNFAAPALIALIPVVVSPYMPPSSPRLPQILLYSLVRATIACCQPRVTHVMLDTSSVGPRSKDHEHRWTP